MSRWLAIAGLFFLSAIEGSLAILREQIVAADAALKLSLAGDESRIVESASHSMIPIVGRQYSVPSGVTKTSSASCSVSSKNRSRFLSLSPSHFER